MNIAVRKVQIKKIFVLIPVLAMMSCSGDRSREILISNQLNLCADGFSSTKIDIKMPVDVEFVDVTTHNNHVSYIFDKYPRRKDFSEEMENKSPIVSNTLKTRLIHFNKSDKVSYAYIRFNRLNGSKYPFAYAEITSSTYDKEQFIELIKSIRYCKSP